MQMTPLHWPQLADPAAMSPSGGCPQCSPIAERDIRPDYGFNFNAGFIEKRA
jgi:hypothetical protein